METLTTEKGVTANTPSPKASTFRQAVRFGLHLLALYAIVNITTMWLAGFTHGKLLPLIQQHPPTVSSFQFALSHLFIFSFWPAVVVAFVYAHWYRHKVAYFVWVVPLVVLAYKFLVFPAHTSVLSGIGGQFSAAFHYYISGNFVIAEFYSYRELFDMAATNLDMTRGMDQYRFTAPLYAGIGYGLGTLLGMKLRSQKLDSILHSMKPGRAGAQ
jgi:hypothetical protein